MCRKIVEHAAKIRTPHPAAVLFQLGGALNRLGEEHSAVGNREARCIFNVTGSWEHAVDDAANIAWVRDAWNDLRSFSTGGTYPNFLTQDEGPERTEAALGKSPLRLTEVKAK